MEKELTFTLQQIKDAYWKCYHEKGEFWFSYLDGPIENTVATTTYWLHFQHTLLQPKEK
jgi:hypothetical protein